MNIRKGIRNNNKKKEKEAKRLEREISSYFRNYKEKIGSPTLWEYVFPIYNCYEDKDGKITTTGISGTTFYIGNSYFMTASHVLDYNKIYNNVQQIGYLWLFRTKLCHLFRSDYASYFGSNRASYMTMVQDYFGSNRATL